MSKSAIYMANTSTQGVSVNGIIDLGTIIRRFGPNVNLAGTGIQVDGPGYYSIDASFTVAPTAAGSVTITALKDGVAIPGGVATATAAASEDSLNLSISSLVREFCECCGGPSTITFVLTGTAAVISNVAVIIEKI